MKRLAIFVVCMASLFSGVGLASAVPGGAATTRGHWQTVCFMGRYGHPGGCRRFFVGGLVVS